MALIAATRAEGGLVNQLNATCLTSSKSSKTQFQVNGTQFQVNGILHNNKIFNRSRADFMALKGPNL